MFISIKTDQVVAVDAVPEELVEVEVAAVVLYPHSRKLGHHYESEMEILYQTHPLIQDKLDAR